jgi:hypothetical protein
MKKIYTIIIFCTFIAVSVYSQSRAYVTSGFEIIFSEATISDVNNPEATSTLRFAPVINPQSMMNVDISKKIGIFTGLAIRNVGYIYDEYSTVLPDGVTEPIKKKFRTYNLGIPVGLKLGDLSGLFIYGGYEIEFPFVYKEKTFNTTGEKTNTDVYWFGERAEKIQQSWMVGIQMAYGLNLKFKYYFTEFHNQDFTANNLKPYAGLNSKIWYISLTTNLFRNTQFTAINR